MMIGRVRGTAVSTTKARALNGWKLLIVQPINIETLKDAGDPVVVMDGVGAGEGESSCALEEALQELLMKQRRLLRT